MVELRDDEGTGARWHARSPWARVDVPSRWTRWTGERGVGLPACRQPAIV
ncbi:MAG TPA: hypothetical protein VKY71_01195 [Actinotalea caeni]|nr:hypothetical protein [Actinotalea caeni]HLV54170.1 hypothetical protein [Actinotalea caeni]